MDTTAESVDLDAFKEAMARFASGVTVVTTVDADGQRWGFTASAFCSVSVDPPLVLACLATAADCHPAFEATEHFAVNVLGQDDEDLAMTFASKGVDKFAAAPFVSHHETGVPVLQHALTSIVCRLRDRHAAGDHDILVGEALEIRLGERGAPLCYFDRGFWELVGD